MMQWEMINYYNPTNSTNHNLPKKKNSYKCKNNSTICAQEEKQRTNWNSSRGFLLHKPWWNEHSIMWQIHNLFNE